LAEKFSSEDVPGRDTYRLTEKGESPRPVMSAIAKWGLEQIDGTAALMKPAGTMKPAAAVTKHKGRT